jgi:hypothetical protein
MTLAIPLIIICGVLAWVLRPGKRPANLRVFAILATVIPPVLVWVAATVAQMLYNSSGKTGVSDIANILFIVGLGLMGAALLALAGFAIAHKGDVSRGTGFGLCIAVVLAIAEFALLEGLAGLC